MERYLRGGKESRGEPVEMRRHSHLYIWRTVHDDRVRSSHASNDGKIFDDRDPPPTGNPGEGYNCRCTADYNIPTYVDIVDDVRGIPGGWVGRQLHDLGMLLSKGEDWIDRQLTEMLGSEQYTEIKDWAAKIWENSYEILQKVTVDIPIHGYSRLLFDDPDAIHNFIGEQLGKYTTPEQRKVVGYALAATAAAKVTRMSLDKVLTKLDPHGTRKFHRSTLRDHEGGLHGGHAIERHGNRGGKEYLEHRIKHGRNGKGMSKASAYFNEKQANKITDKVKKANKKKIDDWIKDAKIEDRLNVELDFDRPIGYGLKKGSDEILKSYKAQVWLEKTKEGTKIITSFPEIK